MLHNIHVSGQVGFKLNCTEESELAWIKAKNHELIVTGMKLLSDQIMIGMVLIRKVVEASLEIACFTRKLYWPVFIKQNCMRDQYSFWVNADKITSIIPTSDWLNGWRCLSIKSTNKKESLRSGDGALDNHVTFIREVILSSRAAHSSCCQETHKKRQRFSKPLSLECWNYQLSINL